MKSTQMARMRKTAKPYMLCDNILLNRKCKIVELFYRSHITETFSNIQATWHLDQT